MITLLLSLIPCLSFVLLCSPQPTSPSYSVRSAVLPCVLTFGFLLPITHSVPFLCCNHDLQPTSPSYSVRLAVSTTRLSLTRTLAHSLALPVARSLLIVCSRLLCAANVAFLLRAWRAVLPCYHPDPCFLSLTLCLSCAAIMISRRLRAIRYASRFARPSSARTLPSSFLSLTLRLSFCVERNSHFPVLRCFLLLLTFPIHLAALVAPVQPGRRWRRRQEHKRGWCVTGRGGTVGGPQHVGSMMSKVLGIRPSRL